MILSNCVALTMKSKKEEERKIENGLNLKCQRVGININFWVLFRAVREVLILLKAVLLLRQQFSTIGCGETGSCQEKSASVSEMEGSRTKRADKQAGQGTKDWCFSCCCEHLS